MAQERQKTANHSARAKQDEHESPDQGREKRAEFLTARQLAEVLQISETTVHRLRRAGRIPAVLLTDRLIRFNLKDVQKALKPTVAARDGEQAEDQASTAQLSFDDLYADFKA
ncbi:MAG TPA: helix-turn-helix domain-containing protein [Blastocatellia bacterium]|nr:helix-turn-helix domain-containing protein [Blastocatellia bacterium]